MPTTQHWHAHDFLTGGSHMWPIFCQNQTLLCRTSNGDTAKKVLWGQNYQVWDFYKIAIIKVSKISR